MYNVDQWSGYWVLPVWDGIIKYSPILLVFLVFDADDLAPE